MNRILLCLFTLLSSPVFAGTNYYVSNSGSNSNSGLTTLLAFKTITYATTVATHGDTINVMAGVYTNATYGTWDVWKTEQAVRINNKNASSGNYLVIKPYGGAVKIKSDGNFIVQIRNSSYIRVEGFELEGETNNIPLDSALKYQFVYRDNTLGKDTFRVAFGTAASVVSTMTFPVLTNTTRPTVFNADAFIVQGSHHIDIVNNNIHHSTSAGLRIAESDYINIINNQIYDCNQRTSVGTPALVLSLINSIDTNNGVKINISRNKVYNNFNVLYSWNGSKTFITPIIDEGKGISLEHCITRPSPDPSWHHGRVRIDNNICYRNGFSGINTNEAERVDVINNTCYQNISSGRGTNTGISINETNDAQVINNIIVSNNSFGGDALASRVSTRLRVWNNLVDGTIDADIDAIDTNTIFANPMFVDTLSFQLQSTSQAIDSCLNSVAPTIDFYGNPRDAKPDRGAVEYKAITAIKNSSVADYKVFPNPTKGEIYIVKNGVKSIQVFSLDGREVTRELDVYITSSFVRLNLDKVADGIYFIRADNEMIRILKSSY